MSLAEILAETRSRNSDYAESTIRTHVTSRMCRNAPNHHATTFDDFESLGGGVCTDCFTEVAEVLLAGSVDLESALNDLAVLRPIFHSEADFQLAFAWQVQQRDAAMQVRLETRPAVGVHLDLAFARPDLGRTTAVELKYLTRLWGGTVDGKRYELKNHGAQDIRAYDIIKDIVRVEKFVAGTAGADGAVIVIANWRPAKSNDSSNAAAFRVSEGVVLTGSRAWGPNTGAGTMRAREVQLDVAGEYDLHWSDYSTLPGGGTGATFRKLIVHVASSTR